MIFRIDRNRLELELNHNAKSKGKGVLNWYITPEEILQVYYCVYGVTYLYEVPAQLTDPVLRERLSLSMSVLGIVEPEEHEEESPIQITQSRGSEVVGDL